MSRKVKPQLWTRHARKQQPRERICISWRALTPPTVIDDVRVKTARSQQIGNSRQELASSTNSC
jgi:hypothetical protein